MTVDKPVTREFVAGMAGGVPVLDTVTRRCRVWKVDERTFRIVLTQGLNRQIRRMCEHFGYRVRRLQRVRIVNVRLGGLKTGHWRTLRDDELAGLLPERDLPAVRRAHGGEPTGEEAGGVPAAGLDRPLPKRVRRVAADGAAPTPAAARPAAAPGRTPRRPAPRGTR